MAQKRMCVVNGDAMQNQIDAVDVNPARAMVNPA
jgi:hypothetical protein